MGVDNLLHYGKIRWLHGADKESGSATIRNNFITGKGKKDNENDATLFSTLNFENFCKRRFLLFYKSSYSS